MPAVRTPDRNTLKIDDTRSIRSLRKNKADEEIDQQTYLKFLIAQLKRRNGVMLDSELRAAVIKHFAASWSVADKRKAGKTPKWVNTIAWVKANRKDLFRSVKFQGQQIIILMAFDGRHAQLQEYVRQQPRKKMNTVSRRCPLCYLDVPLTYMICACGYEWADRAKRRSIEIKS